MRFDGETIQGFISDAPSGSHWDRIGVRRRFGVCVPLFSLRSRRDCGIGDVGDLPALVDWCVRIGADVIQLLPVNDMGLDGVPYAALSAFALDPVFVALDLIPGAADDADFLHEISTASLALNSAPGVRYHEVRRVKMALLEQAFRKADGAALRRNLDEFRAANPWLDDYLPYRVLKEIEGFRSWEDWGPGATGPHAVRDVLAAHGDRIDLHLFAQWVLDRQFREAREHAARNGVLLEGDIPILVSRDSADVWRHPELFNLDVSAGAPPDMYSREGQNWGFPTYKWHEHWSRGNEWWQARLRQAERYFDLYRIDHVVGFFRIWTIPLGERNGLNGRFVPSEEWTWGGHGRGILEMMLGASRMLPLAEDLGTIPDVCRDTLKDMGICGFKVQRWEKRWHEDRRFIPPSDYHPLSMATLSTHDSEMLADWWETEPSESRELFALLGHGGQAPSVLPPDLHREILTWIRGAGSLFVVLMLQELLGPEGLLPGHPREHRINVPGTVADSNWTWRCPVDLEDLLSNEQLVRAILRTSPTPPI